MLTDASSLIIAGANVGGTLTLTGGGSIGQTGAIIANGVVVTTTGGAITLTNTGNNFGTAGLQTSGADNAFLYDAANLVVTGTTVGGTLTLTSAEPSASRARSTPQRSMPPPPAATSRSPTPATASQRQAWRPPAPSNASLYDSANLTIASANIGGALTLTGGGTIGQSGAIHAHILKCGHHRRRDHADQ